MFIDKSLKFLIALSTIIFACLILLYFIRIPVHLDASVSTSDVSFNVMGDIDDFLSTTTLAAESIEISSFEKMEVKYQKIIKPKTESNGAGNILSIETEDASGVVRFYKGVSINSLNITPDVEVSLSVIEDGSYSLLEIKLAGLQGGITLTDANSSTKLRGIGAFYSTKDSTGNIDEIDDSNIEFKIAEHNAIKVYPDQSSLIMRIRLPNTVSLSEEDVIEVSNIRFVKRRQTNNSLPAITKGKLHLTSTNRSIVVGRRQPLSFSKKAIFTIRELRITKSNIELLFEGSPQKVLVGFSRQNQQPSILEYLMKNQTLLLLINSYILVITFFMTLMKLNKREEK